MGADLIINWVIFEDMPKEDIGEELQKRKGILLKAINDASNDDLNEYYDNNGFYLGEDISQLPQEDKRKKHKELVGSLFNCLDYRDVTYLYHKGDRIYMTGGMSYGDNPTGSYDAFENFNYISEKILSKARIK